MAIEIKKVVFGIVDLVNKYQAYGWLIFVIMVGCSILSYSAYNYTTSHEKVYIGEKQTWLDAYNKVDDKLENLDKRTTVIESKLDLLIQMNTIK